MDLQLKGKRVVVTGASKGIGFAIAKTFAREGAVVFMAARNAERLEAAAAQIRTETGAKVSALALDASAADAGERLLKFGGDIEFSAAQAAEKYPKESVK